MAFNYRLSERVKNNFIEFFQKIFVLYSEEKTQFTDGYFKVSFGQVPKCQSVDTYDFKYLPTVVVSVTNVTAKDYSINKFIGYYDESGLATEAYGGFANINLNFQVRARTSAERNNLADIVSMYLNSIETKKAFHGTHGIAILGAPTFSGESVEADMQTNVPLFTTNIRQEVFTEYEESADVVDTLGNIGLKIEDFVSYLQPDVHDYIKLRKDAGDTDAQVKALLITKYNVSATEAQVLMNKYNLNTLKNLYY